MNNIIKITISASMVAWYAAIISTVMIVLRLFELYKDRVNVIVKCNKNMRILGDPTNNDYISIIVSNRGKRPVTIGFVFVVMKGRNLKDRLCLDSIKNGNRELTEGKSTSFELPQNLIDIKKIKYIQVNDITGRKFIGRLR